MDEDMLYTIFKAKDVRFDGKFFIGVKTTGIYCRPVCTARLPKKENCTYYHTPIDAEKHGFRPCLLCRPELSPSNYETDGEYIIQLAKKVIEEHLSHEHILQSVCKQIGCSDRHLRRLFKEHVKVTPLEYITTCRLLLAKKLLTDTTITITSVALSCGFGSVRRFNDVFKKNIA